MRLIRAIRPFIPRPYHKYVQLAMLLHAILWP